MCKTELNIMIHLFSTRLKPKGPACLKQDKLLATFQALIFLFYLLCIHCTAVHTKSAGDTFN